MINPLQFEVCANSVESCIAAQAGGAHRVELCAGISEGGTTPSYGEIITARELLHIKLHVIIRPRGGDFVYSELEAQIMERDIELARKAGVDGVVFGCLTSEGEIDIPLCSRLMKASEGVSVTFHRAFDECSDPLKALEEIIALGCDRILTSGQEEVAQRGTALIKELVERSAGRIIILPGSGINETNIRQIATETGAREFHFSVREQVGNQSVTTIRRVEETINALR